MEIEEQKSSLVINYKPSGNKRKGKVAMSYWPQSGCLWLQMLIKFILKQEKKPESMKIWTLSLQLVVLRVMKLVTK